MTESEVAQLKRDTQRLAIEYTDDDHWYAYLRKVEEALEDLQDEREGFRGYLNAIQTS